MHPEKSHGSGAFFQGIGYLSGLSFIIIMNNETLSPLKKTILGVQFLFIAFGATVLVPLLVGLDPATALMTAGIGTFIFHLVTKGKVPIFLGSSFAFIAPIIAASKQWGMPGTLAGIIGDRKSTRLNSSH